MEDRWLSVTEIATYLGVTAGTVYKWVAQRQMPGHRVGRLWKFKRQEVDGWVHLGGAREAPEPLPSPAWPEDLKS